jgi:hypothetical protein
VEAASDELLLHLRTRLDPGQEHLQAQRQRRRAVCAGEHAEPVLIGPEGRRE